MARPYVGTGVAHIIIGSLCVAAGVVFAAMLGAYTGERQSRGSDFSAADNATTYQPTSVMGELQYRGMAWLGFLACSKIWCGIWFVVTGAVGVSVRQKGPAETAYLTLSILNIVLWAPATMALNGIVAYFSLILIIALLASSFYWLLLFPILGIIFGIIELILSIVSSSIVCCCSRAMMPQNHLAESVFQYEMKLAV